MHTHVRVVSCCVCVHVCVGAFCGRYRAVSESGAVPATVTQSPRLAPRSPAVYPATVGVGIEAFATPTRRHFGAAGVAEEGARSTGALELRV